MEKSRIKTHFDSLAPDYDYWLNRNRYYHDCINSFYASIIPQSSRILEIGCATGELLDYLKPVNAIGIDISNNMITQASKKFSHIKFIAGDIADPSIINQNERFPYIICFNIVDYSPDIISLFSKTKTFLDEDGLIIVTTENPFWEPILRLASRLKLRMPDGPRNYVTNADLENIANLSGLEVVKKGLKFFMPVNIPLISPFLNFIFSELPLLRNLCLLQYMVIRMPKKRKELSCSVIIPCHNEAENITQCISRVPKMGKNTEIIIIDDGSTDLTKEIVQNICKTDPRVRLITYKNNIGKGPAVKLGFEAAEHEVLMILDADMAVMPEELPLFFDAIQDGKADFVNGTRMIYPMQNQAMRSANYLGNVIFSLVLSWLLEQRITDTLCGTKVLLKKDFQRIKMGRCKWGDFDILFGAAKLKRKICEVPVHYQNRVAGKSKMKVIRHGLLLLKMCFVGFWELKVYRGREKCSY